MMAGMDFHSGLRRTPNNQSTPFCSGMCQSSTMICGSVSAACMAFRCACASMALAAVVTTKPQASSCEARISTLMVLSSTTSTRVPGASSRPCAESEVMAGAAGSVIASEKVEPWPGWLTTVMSPPMSVASWRLIARPSPVPPKRRVVEPSSCTKASKIAAWFSGRMPVPVSTTSMTSDTCVSDGFTPRARISTWPLAVNLSAFDTRFMRIWRMRSSSPLAQRCRYGSMSSSSSMPFWCARCANRSMTSSTTWRMSRSCVSRRSLPASIFEKSRMSLMMASSASAELWMVAAKRRWRGSSLESSSSSVMPSTPFIGVRISCDMRARNSLLARAGGLGDAAGLDAVVHRLAQRAVRFGEALGALVHLRFEQFLLARQLLLAVLDLARASC